MPPQPDRGPRGQSNRYGQGALHVHFESSAYRHSNSFLTIGLETGRADFEGVDARGEKGKPKRPPFISRGRGRPGKKGGRRYGYDRIGQGGPRLVLHRANDFPGNDLPLLSALRIRS